MRPDRSRPHFLVTAHTGVDRLAAALRLAGSRRAAAEPSGGSSRAHNTATTAHYRDPTQLLGQGSGCEDIGQKLQTTLPQLSRLFRRESRKKVSESVVRVGCGLGGRVEEAAARKDVCRTNRQRQHGD